VSGAPPSAISKDHEISMMSQRGMSRGYRTTTSGLVALHSPEVIRQ
jgi:hypothetical protein